MVNKYKRPQRKRKQKLFRRQNGICGICGEPMKMKDTSVDHILPRSFGGNNTLENVRLTHRVCNTERGARIEEGEIDWELVSDLLVTPVGQQIKWRDLYIEKLETALSNLKLAYVQNLRDWPVDQVRHDVETLMTATKERLKKDAKTKGHTPRDYQREKRERSGRPIQSRITRDP